MKTQRLLNYGILLMLILVVVLGTSSGISPDVMVRAEEPNNPEFLVPRWINTDGQPHFDEQGVRVKDYSNLLHGVFMLGGLSRTSEIGHDNYRPELAEEEMKRRGNLWLEILSNIEDTFYHRGALKPFLTESEEGWKVAGNPQLADYPGAVYTYHMHHRAGRWEDHGLFYPLTFAPSQYISFLGRYLLESRFQEGMFYYDDNLEEYDHESMSYGLGGINSHVYAWIRWSKPDGEEDMGQLSEERLAGYLGYGPDDLVEISRKIKNRLDEAWNEDSGIYDFGSGTEYSLEALGSLIKGHKALYETLYLFGNEEDETEALELFERTAQIMDDFLESEVTRDWGLPSRVAYTEMGVEAASDKVNIKSQWEFINLIFGGFGITRERHTSMFMNEHRPDLLTSLGEFTDRMIEGALDYQLDDGYLVSEVSWETGDITDSRHSVSAIGLFTAGAGNVYRNGQSFERASDWDDADSDVASRSQQLYDVFIKNIELLEESAIIRDQ